MKILRNPVSAALVLALGVTAAGLAQSAPAHPAPNQVVIVHLKPDMVSEWIDLTKYEVIPALKKAGVKRHETWQTIFGNTLEYVLGTPLDKYADLDGPNPIARALGPQKALRLAAEVSKCLDSREVFMSTPIPELSNHPGGGSPQYQVFVLHRVDPGKIEAYQAFLKNQFLPIYKNAGARMDVTRRTIGGNPNEFAVHIWLNNLGDLDTAPLPVRVLGPGGAAKLQASEDALAPIVEIAVRRRVADLSF